MKENLPTLTKISPIASRTPLLNLPAPGIHRLTAMQMAGIADDPPTLEQVVKAFGTSSRRVAEIERRALLFIGHFHPHLRDELLSISS